MTLTSREREKPADTRPLVVILSVSEGSENGCFASLTSSSSSLHGIVCKQPLLVFRASVQHDDCTMVDCRVGLASSSQ